MVQAASRIKTFEDFLTVDTGDDRLYEWINGELVLMAEPTIEHEDIADFLYDRLNVERKRQGLDYVVKRRLSVKLKTASDELIQGRRPDVVVMEGQQWRADRRREAAAYEPPLLAIEVVSQNWRDDYILKKAEYEQTGILEYWILDYRALARADYLLGQKVPTLFICNLIHRAYETQCFRSQDPIHSQIFPNLKLTLEQIIRAAEV